MALQHNPYARVKKPLKSDMNVVPYIDVMLVLLVIFMVTAPMLTTGLKVDLPKTTSDHLSLNQQLPAIVSIKPNHQYYLRFGESHDEALSLDEIQYKLLQAQTQTSQPLMVLVNGEAAVAYGDVVLLMSSLQQAGLTQVGLLTQAPDVNSSNNSNNENNNSAESFSEKSYSEKSNAVQSTDTTQPQFFPLNNRSQTGTEP